MLDRWWLSSVPDYLHEVKPEDKTVQANAKPSFLDIHGRELGRRFAVYHAPAIDQIRGQIVYLHPFAEEMNKSRRMAALQSRALASAGFAVLQLDLLGSGDSEGDFGDASWDLWVEDAAFAVGWLAERAAGPLWLWGLRAGCLLASDLASRLDQPSNFLFWQPAISGKLLLKQFLRTKIAAEMSMGKSNGLMDQLRARLNSGESVDVAGYTLSPAMATGLDRAELRPPTRPSSSIWLELSLRQDDRVTAGMAASSAQWNAAGSPPAVHSVQGPAFWQTTEINDAPNLIDATVGAMTAMTA